MMIMRRRRWLKKYIKFKYTNSANVEHEMPLIPVIIGATAIVSKSLKSF
jgi:hypothetical protein